MSTNTSRDQDTRKAIVRKNKTRVPTNVGNEKNWLYKQNCLRLMRFGTEVMNPTFAMASWGGVVDQVTI